MLIHLTKMISPKQMEPQMSVRKLDSFQSNSLRVASTVPSEGVCSKQQTRQVAEMWAHRALLGHLGE